jgi:hypothetical protein
MTRILGTAVLLAGMAGFAFAGTVTAPEIDGSSAVAAVALLGGAVMVLRSRRKK